MKKSRRRRKTKHPGASGQTIIKEQLKRSYNRVDFSPLEARPKTPGIIKASLKEAYKPIKGQLKRVGESFKQL